MNINKLRNRIILELIQMHGYRCMATNQPCKNLELHEALMTRAQARGIQSTEVLEFIYGCKTNFLLLSPTGHRAYSDRMGHINRNQGQFLCKKIHGEKAVDEFWQKIDEFYERGLLKVKISRP